LDDEPDDIDKTLSLALVEHRSSTSSTSENSLALSDPLASSSWDKVGNGFLGEEALFLPPGGWGGLVLYVFVLKFQGLKSAYLET